MKRKRRTVAVAAVTIAVAVATVAAILARAARSDRKTTDSHLVGDKVLEMLFCVPGMCRGAMESAPSSIGTAASAAARTSVSAAHANSTVLS